MRKEHRCSKWQPCAGGYHLWPEHLNVFAVRCCQGCESAAPPTYVPNYLCTKGRHCWSSREDAIRCCNGYVPVLKTVMSMPRHDKVDVGLCEVRERVLVPVSTVTEMDDLASYGGGQDQLYLPM